MPGNPPMTEAMYYLLLALLRPAHGYRLMQQVGEASGEGWRWGRALYMGF